MLFEKESFVIRGICFALYKLFRNRHKERIYHEAFILELEKNGFVVEKEKRIPIQYDGKVIGTYVPDIVVDDKIIIELKAKPHLSKDDQSQFWSYLKAAPYTLGFLVNFGAPDGVQIKRFIDTPPDKQQQQFCISSVQVPHSSVAGTKGQLALLSLLIIGAITLAAALSASFIGRTELTKGFRRSIQEQAQSLADSCLEEGLYRVKSDANYDGGVFSMGDGTCSITVVDDSATTKIITVQAKVQTLTRKAEAKVQINPFKILSRTEQVSDAFHQTDWGGGADTAVSASHNAGNQYDWNKFSSTTDVSKLDFTNGEVKWQKDL